MPSQRFIGPVLLVLLSAATLHAEDTWTEVRSPHFRVITNSSTSEGRKVAGEFEQMRSVFASRFKSEVLEPPAPLTIIAARDEETLRALEPHEWKATHGMVAGEFLEGWEREFATVRLDTWGDQNQVVAYHEYTHSVMHRLVHWMPTWLDEGLAEFYGATQFRSDRIYVGAPSPGAEYLSEASLLPLETLFDPKSLKLFKDDHDTSLFYAESWALVHYMTLGEGMENGAKINTFINKLDAGEKQDAAFLEVFGNRKAFEKKFQSYALRHAFLAATIRTDDKLNPKDFPAHKLTPAQTQFELGCFRLHSQEEAAGRASLNKAIALDPSLADAYEELAYLDFAQGHDDAARKEWQKALEINPSQWRSLFALTMLDAGPGMVNLPDDKLGGIFSALRKVSTLAPRYAPAYVEKAILEWKLGLMQRAYADAHQAETLEPWRAEYHLLTAHILLNGSKPKLAAEYARMVADRWTSTDHNEAVDLLHKIPAGFLGSNPIPALDVPENTTVAHGVLQKVVCAEPSKDITTFTFLPDGSKDGKPIELKVDKSLAVGFSDTLWWGEDHFSECHHLEGYRALIAYNPQKNLLEEVDVRDNLPAPKETSVAEAASKP